MGLKESSPREKLKKLRESLGMTLRDVEEHSKRMGEGKETRDLVVSRGWLGDIENGVHVPSIFKLYTLSVIYCRDWVYLNSLFNLRMDDLAKDQILNGCHGLDYFRNQKTTCKSLNGR